MGVNFSVIARRSAPAPVNMPAHLRPAVAVTITGPVRKTRALPMTGAMRSGDGTGASAWTRSAHIGGSVGAVIRDQRWSATVGDHG